MKKVFSPSVIASCLALMTVTGHASANNQIDVKINNDRIIVHPGYLICPPDYEIVSEEYARNNLRDIGAYIGTWGAVYLSSGNELHGPGSFDNDTQARIVSGSPNSGHSTLCMSQTTLNQIDVSQFFVVNRGNGRFCPTGSQLVGSVLARQYAQEITKNWLGEWGWVQVDETNILGGYGYNNEIKAGSVGNTLCMPAIEEMRSDIKSLPPGYVVDSIELLPYSANEQSASSVFANGRMQFPVHVKVKLHDSSGKPINQNVSDYLTAQDINGNNINLIRLYKGPVAGETNGSEISIDGDRYGVPNEQWKSSRIRNKYSLEAGISDRSSYRLSEKEINEGWHIFTYWVSTTEILGVGDIGQICARAGDELGLSGNNGALDSCANNQFVSIKTERPRIFSTDDFTIKENTIYNSEHERVTLRSINILPNNFKLLDLTINALPKGNNLDFQDAANRLDSPYLSVLGRYMDYHPKSLLATEQLTGSVLFVNTYINGESEKSVPLTGFKYWNKDIHSIHHLNLIPNTGGITLFNAKYGMHNTLHDKGRGWSFDPQIQKSDRFGVKLYDIPEQTGTITGVDSFGNDFKISFQYDADNVSFEVLNIR